MSRRISLRSNAHSHARTMRQKKCKKLIPARKTARTLRVSLAHRGRRPEAFGWRSEVAVAAHGCQTHTQSAAAEAAWSRRASRASQGYGGRGVSGAITAASRSSPSAVGRLWTRAHEKGTEPERSAHRGSCGAGLKHRARDAGQPADLRLYLLGNLGVARRRGPRVPRDPGVPRRPRLWEAC